jgi:hypothetical protein
MLKLFAGIGTLKSSARCGERQTIKTSILKTSYDYFVEIPDPFYSICVYEYTGTKLWPLYSTRERAKNDVSTYDTGKYSYCTLLQLSTLERKMTLLDGHYSSLRYCAVSFQSRF